MFSLSLSTAADKNSDSTYSPSENITPTATNTVVCTPSDTVASAPSESLSTPSDTLPSSPSDPVTSAPSDTLATTPSDTLASTPSDTLTCAPSNTLTSTPSDTLASDPISLRITLARERLLRGGFYLGDSSVIQSLHWVQDGRGHALTSTSKADSTANDDDVHMVLPGDFPSHSANHATLSAIVRVDRNDFWLTSDGGYQGPSALCKEILHVKPSCALTDPGTMPVSTDYVTVQVFSPLMGMVSLVSNYATNSSRHVSCIDGSDDGDQNSEKDDEAGIKMQDWPLTKEKNRAELLALSSTHRILPLPAYDVAGNLIRPAAYRRCLQGAVVEVHFTLTHWGIAKAKRDVYGGEIQLMHVLVPPPTPTSPSKKRKLAQHLEPDETPAAKIAKTET
ncbi:hypothetical protein EDD15DRAFT_2364660 [Pisolithus albus]|nr:hypothetical protein EDD15DRAFT_2364660 [Pisolithus albus]